jgi:type I restriction enzyme S subunit
MLKYSLQELIEKPISGEWGNEGGSTKVIRTTNFSNIGVINYENVVLRDIEQNKIDLKKLIKGDIIIEKSGGSPTQPVGRVVFFDSNEVFLCNNFTAILRPKPELVFPKYLHYILFVSHQKGLTSSFQNKTTGIINLQLVKYIENLQIPLPPLEQQKKIAAILDAADAYRQKTKALIAKYDELTQSLFLDMFGDPVKNNMNLPFPKIRGLTNVSQGMQIAIKERHKENGPNRYKYLTVAYLNGRKDEEFIESPRASVVCNKDEILMIRTGNTGQVVTNVEGVFHNNFFKIDWDKKRLNKNYLVYFLSNPGIRRDLLKRASTTTIPDLSHSQFYDINIILPPIELQNQFAERVQAIEEQKVKAQASLEKAEELFNSLLQRAFNGELV